MKRLILACLLAISSHGWAADLDPECYELYDQFLAADWVNAGRVAGRMHDMQCWPALQNPGSLDNQPTLPPATSCPSLVPHVVKMINDRAESSGYSVLQIADAKPMTFDTIDRVAAGHDLYVINYLGQRVRKSLQHDDRIYRPGRGYFKISESWTEENVLRYGDNGGVLVPNSEPFTARPLTGSVRTLDCSGEAGFTNGSYLIQMYMDRSSSGQEFIGMQVLMELR